MKTSINTKYDYAEFLKTIRALKAIRLQKGFSRAEAAAKVGWSARSFEQLENGRCNFSEERLKKILAAYGISESEFDHVRRQPKLALAETCKNGKADRSLGRKPRRNHLKIVTKEVRVLRVLRKRRGLSQYAASKLCGFAPSMFGHIEEGRIELRPDRISHILGCLGSTQEEFQQLIDSPVLRDDLLADILKLAERLDDAALSSAHNIIKALAK